MTRILVFIVVAACALGAAGHASAQPFGFSGYASAASVLSPAEDAGLQARAGATIARIPMEWRAIQPTPTTWRLSLYDQIYAAHIAAGVRPIFTLSYAPRWAWSSPTLCDPSWQDCRLPPGPAMLDAWKDVVRGLVVRYPQMAGLEIWNEPNLIKYWQGVTDPAYYTRLVAAAKEAMREAGSTVPLIGGSLSQFLGPDTPERGMSFRTFLAAAYRAGLARHIDGLSVHPYPAGINLWYTFQTLTETRELREIHGDTTPLWVTELGITTTGAAGDPVKVTEPEQAAHLVQILRLMRDMPDVAGVLYHTMLESSKIPTTSQERGYGLLRPDRSPKPGYCAVAAFNRAPFTCPAGVAAPSVSDTQSKRWDAQILLQRAVDAARAYRRFFRTYAGLSSAWLHAIDPRLSATAPDITLMPGAAADPSRVGAWTFNIAGVEYLLLCNTSKADRSYCVQTAYGTLWRYGRYESNIGATATLITQNKTRTW